MIYKNILMGLLGVLISIPAWTQNLTTTDVDPSATISVQRFLQVTDEIYRGGRPSIADLSTLQTQYKIQTIIDLEDDTKVMDQEQQQTEKLGMTFLATPLNPYGTPTDADMNNILAQMQDPKNVPVFVHCHYGEDRTGLAIGLYRVLVQKWSPDQAYQEMLANGFHPALKGLDNYYRKRTGYAGK